MRVYTDGSCRDGVGGWAWWNPETKKWGNGFEDDSTHQRMELMAALEAINNHYDDRDLVIVSDSRYLVNCFGERWWVRWLENGWIGSDHKSIVNRSIWEPLLDVVREHGNIKFEWIKGHSGNPDNNKADELALSAVIEREKNTAPAVEGSLKPGTLECGYCGKPAETHFLVLDSRAFVATCKRHARQLRLPLVMSEAYDEHPWSEQCNVPGSVWSIPYEKGTISFCMVGR